MPLLPDNVGTSTEPQPKPVIFYKCKFFFGGGGGGGVRIHKFVFPAFWDDLYVKNIKYLLNF